MALTIILTILVAILGLYYLTKKSNAYRNHSYRGLPFKKAIPIFGSSWRSMFQLQSFAEMSQEIYNMSPSAKYVAFRHRSADVIMLRDPELIKSIAIKNFDCFPNHRGFGDAKVEPFFAKNLLLLRDERWKEVRSMLRPAFTSSKLRAMFELISDCAVKTGCYLSSLPEGKRMIEAKDVFTRFTNDVFASCAFGIEVDSVLDRDNRFYTLGKEALDIHSVGVLKFLALIFLPRLAQALGLRLIRREVTKFFEEIVSEGIKSRENGVHRPDFIQLMMEARGKLAPGKELTVEDMTAQAFVFFFGGFETTSSLLCFIAHELAMNPGIQRTLKNEIDEISKESDGEITYEAIKKMKFLDAVINEALRMYPVIPITDRQCSKPFELPPALPGLEPFILEEDSHVWLPIYAIQRDPKYFRNPDEFNPNRFLDKQDIVNSGVFLPFGMGPRICVANTFAILQAKIALFHILAQCELKVCDKTSVPMRFKKRGAFLTADKGFWMEVTPRTDLVISDKV